MLNAINKLLVSKLNGLLLLVALTGFVCTHKIQAEEECLSSNVLCYECDSRYDSNCADPFDFLDTTATEESPLRGQHELPPDSTPFHRQQQQQPPRQQPEMPQDQQQQQQYRLAESYQTAGPLVQTQRLANSTNGTQANGTMVKRPPKKLPPVKVCHGCCVKITSRLPDGVTYVKRTCTSNIQINYFMVGIVCMKESGDRGKMCFCETDYCNGQPSIIRSIDLLTLFRMLIVVLLSATYLSTRARLARS